MNTLSRSAYLLAARTSLAFVVLSFALLGAWTAGDLFGQPPAQQKKRVEEEEETPKVKKQKVIRVEEEDNSKTKPEANRPAGTAGSGDLAQLAEQERHPALKTFFRSLAVPHDLVVFQRSSVTINGERRQHEEETVVPTPLYLGNDPGRFGEKRLRFTTLTLEWKTDRPLSLDPERLAAVRPYEEIALDKVKDFLGKDYDRREGNDPLYLSRYKMLTAAEQALSSVLRWHVSAIPTGQRSGKEWDKVEKNLRSQLLDVRLGQMKELSRAKDWDRVLDLTHRLAVNYSNANERILIPVVDMLQQAINGATSSPETKRDAFKRLHELEMEFPNNPALRPLSTMLQTRAKGLLAEATKLSDGKNDSQKLQQARELLKQIEETWPQLEGVANLRAKISLDYPILRVGVRGPLPKYFSPAWACTDNERRIVELLFESLVKMVPDGSGGFRYRPALAESAPKVVPLGRRFELPRNAFWSDGSPLMLRDIESSLVLLKDNKGVGLSRVWGELLANTEAMRNPFQLILKLNQGFLEPLAPMTFKVVPLDKPITEEEFAKQPVTSGPFRLELERSGQSDETKRLALVFVANPSYGHRPTKRDLPHIQEIRFYSYDDNTDLARELSNRNLDLVLDLTAKQAEELRKNQNTDIVVPLPSPSLPNQRIYFLAINTRKLEDPKLRQALSFAIDRERLLKEHFRASLTGLHKVLSGPFPAGSWACKPINEADKANQNLFNPQRAQLLKPQGRVGPFQLKYAADNPSVDEAIKHLCAQVKERTGVVLEPTPCDPYKLRNDVEKVKDYDVAYYHYDFPDEGYWLAPLFKPPPGTDDTNIFKYQNSDLTALLNATKNFRNFAEVQKHQWSIQELLDLEMPFIPLWQLDPLLAYRRNVQPSALDPLLVFDDIEQWRLLPK